MGARDDHTWLMLEKAPSVLWKPKHFTSLISSQMSKLGDTNQRVWLGFYPEPGMNVQGPTYGVL